MHKPKGWSSRKIISTGIILVIKQMNTVKFWTVRFLPMLTVTPVKHKMIPFPMVSKPIILPTTITIMVIPVGGTILPIFP
jgi:ABC-type uncharacterized transport system permease subunit